MYNLYFILYKSVFFYVFTFIHKKTRIDFDISVLN